MSSKRTFLGTAMAAVMSAFALPARASEHVAPTIKRLTGTEDVTINASSGRMRAARRLREHKAQWDSTPSQSTVTRQQRRRSEILKGRQMMTIAKAQAKKDGVMGGSAAINTPLDAMNFLG